MPLLQDWTKQESEDAEGVVTFSYRTEPDNPPDVQTIQKQMAIVAWQPGPNRVVLVPTRVLPSCFLPLAKYCVGFAGDADVLQDSTAYTTRHG